MFHISVIRVTSENVLLCKIIISKYTLNVECTCLRPVCSKCAPAGYNAGTTSAVKTAIIAQCFLNFKKCTTSHTLPVCFITTTTLYHTDAASLTKPH